MATLEERIQNLTQDINPMGAMSDMDRKIAMNAMPRQQSAAIMDMVGKTNGAISNREMEMFRDAVPETVKRNKSLLSGVPDPMMSGVDTSIMQPLVEMGFEQQVRVILSTPQNSPESIQAQQEIIYEMGTGMDIDAFVQTVREVAPPAVQEELLRDRMQPVGAMSNVDAEVMQRLMSAGRDGDTAIGHLTEGEVVIPAPVLEANPQAANMLEQTMTQMGIDPRTRVVDSTGEIGGIASINPETGFQEFGFLSDVWKKAKKVVKAVAPIAVNFIPGVGPLAKAALTAGIGKASGLSTKEALLGGALSYGGSKLFGGTPKATSTGGGFFTGGGSDGIGRFGKVGDFFGGVKKGIGSLFGGGQQPYTDAEIGSMLETMDPSMVEQAVNQRNLLISQGSQSNLGRIEDLFKTVTGDDGMTRTQELQLAGYTPEQIEQLKANGTFNAVVSQVRDQNQGQGRGAVGAIQNALTGGGDDTSSGGMGMMGKLGIAGLAGLIGKLAYDEAKNQKGVPLTPLTQMDQLGRYNIEAEIARRTGAEAPSRVEFGLNPEGMPALSGGSPRMAAYGGIMNLNMGGMPRYNYGGGVQYFNQGGAVAMAEGGDMDATINIEDFPVKDGQIDGPGTETSDDIPAMLSDGEFVMTAKAVKGAGAFNINDNNGILTLTPNGDPSRDSGTRVMYKLMEHFGKVA
jgi:hypothetical protein